MARQTVTCGKLQLSPQACHGCPDNPLGDTQQEMDQQAVANHSQNLDMAERLHDATRMGLLRLVDLTDVEFQMVRLYWWKIEALLRKQSSPFG